jgi:predicted alpha/beta superfamily hydrolase
MVERLDWGGPGSLARHPDLDAGDLPARHVDVWCPPGYGEHPERRYPVVYMHDGQNLFSQSLAYGGQSWRVDAAITALMTDGSLPGAIVVGIWNSQQRWREYMPPLLPPGPEADAWATAVGGPPVTDQYLDFLVGSVKPLIDGTYRTLPEQRHTAVMGSSMGGLVSLYALIRHPDVFGGAGCLSTHWTAGGGLLVAAMGAALPAAGQHRLYFDYGSIGLDAAYEPFQRTMDGYVQAAGYRNGLDWETRSFPGADHNEAAWRARVHLPLAFLNPYPVSPSRSNT